MKRVHSSVSCNCLGGHGSGGYLSSVVTESDVIRNAELSIEHEEGAATLLPDVVG